jgi:2-hydroxycyclohexanecarboxyl-CoA dehydrogenase
VSSTPSVAIITGGAAGIGQACAIRFAREGMNLVVGDIADSGGAQTARSVSEVGREIVAAEGDVANESFCQHLAELAIRNWGRIDVLVANAANRNFSRLVDATESEWDEMLAVNLKGTAFCCKAVMPQMIKQKSGAIVLISSVHHEVGRSEMPIYDATKAGIVSMTKSLAIDHADDNIRVNAICPGLTITDFHIKKAHRQGRSIDELKKTKVGPLQRPAEPAEIAAAVYFMASQEASFITGQALMVDGGLSV